MIEHYNIGDNQSDETDIYINKVNVRKPTSFHSHNFIEIAFVASGSCIHKIENMEYKCSKGDIYIIDYDVPHQFIPYTDSESLIYNCTFKPMFFDYSLINSRSFCDITKNFLLRPFFIPNFQYYWKFSLVDNDYYLILSKYNNMLYEYTSKKEGYIEMLRAYVVELLITLFRFLRQSDIFNDRLINNHDKVIEKVLKYIENNFSDNITLEDLSMQCFLSPSHICREFKKNTGMTVKEFTQKIRIEEAGKLLVETDRKIIDIAQEIGYSDIKHFNAIFKRTTSMTPSQFRKKKK